ncbi:MAG: hypothetical protein RTU92_14215 [Candidatus Thorarchaeota archaeon]
MILKNKGFSTAMRGIAAITKETYSIAYSYAEPMAKLPCHIRICISRPLNTNSLGRPVAMDYPTTGFSAPTRFSLSNSHNLP